MATAEQDTEITLGTGRVLALFFTFVLVCAVFFAIGFSLGRKTTMLGVSNPLSQAAGGAAAAVRPSAGKDNATKPASSNDFSFYKTVGSNSANTDLAPQEQQGQPATAAAGEQAGGATTGASSTLAAGGYFVQVAAVSRQEDADALVDALKKKQYPAFAASNASADKFYHVQVGPYTEMKEAEAMRSRLIADGYNPIVKK